MKRLITVLLLLSSAAILALGQVDDIIICETSEGSPSTEDTKDLVTNLRAADDGNLCFAAQVGKEPGHCGNTIKAYSRDGNGAAFQMCMTEFITGSDDDVRPRRCKGRRPGVIDCRECTGYIHSGELVAQMLEDLSNECENSGRAGGRYLMGWPHGGEVRLIAMPG